jgi:hypothetical protein
MKVLSHRHTGLIVKNFKKMLNFYLGLGFEIRTKELESGLFVNNLIGTKNIVLETAKLILNDQSIEYKYRYQLELMEVKNRKKAQENKKREFNFLKKQGILDLSFTVDNINDVIDYIIDNEGYLINKPLKSVSGFPALHCYMCDPEGNVLHLAENLK